MNFWTIWDAVKEKLFSPAKIRTTVPAFLGALFTFALNRWGVDLTGYSVDLIAEFGFVMSREAVFTIVTTAATYVIYSVISEIEKRRPNAGLLLGRRGAPTYGVEPLEEGSAVIVKEIHGDATVVARSTVGGNIVNDGPEDGELDGYQNI